MHVRRRLLPVIDMVHFWYEGGAFYAGVSHTKPLEPAAHPHPAVPSTEPVRLRRDHPPASSIPLRKVAWIDALVPILDLLAS